MSRFGQAFTRAARDAANLAIASDLATARIEAIRAHTVYTTIVSTYHGTTETSATSGANPSMAGHTGYTRTTSAARTLTDTTDFVTVTVQVIAAVLSKPLRKTAVIAAFR
jgi:hypothetical protein